MNYWVSFQMSVCVALLLLGQSSAMLGGIAECTSAGRLFAFDALEQACQLVYDGCTSDTDKDLESIQNSFVPCAQQFADSCSGLCMQYAIYRDFGCGQFHHSKPQPKTNCPRDTRDLLSYKCQQECFGHAQRFVGDYTLQS
eukprot:TRINITY_DN18813_c1_g1_i1.p2 TRINITY_DN18813_c1_g1~~TRINITY_DN18813_c1_g1_i1.p2  ORF type:complete len:141 (-),score=5.49 TRINITY_DN18813_c1_g1_i1:73-495(-)